MIKRDIKPPQPYPSTVIKVGAVLYRVFAWVDDNGKAQVEIEEWVVRSIKKRRGSQTQYGLKVPLSNSELNQRKYVHLTQKVDGLTWGKLSKKHFDYGWLKSIPQSHRKNFVVGESLPAGIYTTKRAAYQYAISETKAEIKWYEGKLQNLPESEREDYIEELEEYKKELIALERRAKRLKSTMAKAA